MAKNKAKTSSGNAADATSPPPSQAVKIAKSTKNLKQARPANRAVLIRKSNDLVEGRYKFDIWETRIFLKMLTLIKSDDRGFHEYKIYIKDIIDTFHVEGKDSYRLIKEGAKKLMGKILETKIKVEDGWEDFVAPFVAGFKGKGEEKEMSYIKLSFHPDMRPLLLELRERYLVYDFQNVQNLSSPYYVRIYELLKQYEKIGERRFAVDELRDILGLTEEYKLYGHFKSRIILPSQARLAEFTDIQFTFSEIKQGRAVSHLIFHIKQNRPARLLAGKNRPEPRRIASTPVFFEPETEVLVTADNQIFDNFFSKLKEWWGVQADQFRKRLEGKTSEEVERAIEFTKNRIRSGKATNPAGVFLDALAKGHKTLEQHRSEQKRAAANREAALQVQLQPLIDRYHELMDAHTAGVNELVRAVLTVHPELTEEVMEDIKNTQRLMGDRSLETRTLEDFRRDPLLRSMVIAGIMRRFPARFKAVGAQFGPQIELVKHEILDLKPDAIFQ